MSWIAQDDLCTLGLALLHFLWQGVALTALLGIVFAFCRRATLRYALAVLTLGLMVCAPVVTFLLLRHSGDVPPPPVAKASISTPLLAPASAVPAAPQSSPAPRDRWLVEAWFAGVALFSLRAAGGFLLLERLRRRDAVPVSARVAEVCQALQHRLGISRAIRYCESRLLQVPAVIGWFRPVVLLPVTAVTGLSPQQLEIVIAHELAHIRRLDGLVNLFQVAAEALLFYHPAVWWVSRRIRAEREHCCDDVAVALCGGRLEYARALTLMEEWRAAPRLAMAATGSPLARRVLRLLGVESAGGGLRGAGMLAALLCLAVALGAGDALLGASQTLSAPDAASQNGAPDGVKAGIATGVRDGVRGGIKGGIASGIKGGITSGVEGGIAGGKVGAVHGGVTGGVGNGVSGSIQNQDENSSASYIDGLRSAGLSDFTVDQLIAMKIHGVTPDFVRAVRQAGLQVGPEQLVAFRIHQVTPEFIRDIQGTGLRPDPGALVAMKIHGITAAYVRALQAVGPRNAGPDFFVSAKVRGVTADMADKARSRGLHDLDVEQLLALNDMI